MKRHKPYTMEEASRPSPKDYSWDKGTMRFGKWWQRGRTTKEGIGCFSTDPRGERKMFAFIRRHECGEIAVMTTRAACMAVDAMTFAYNVMAVFDECMEAADDLRAAAGKRSIRSTSTVAGNIHANPELLHPALDTPGNTEKVEREVSDAN